MKPTTDKPLSKEQIAQNMQALAWYWEQQVKDLKIEMIPHDKYRELNEALDAAQTMVKVAREKVHGIQYHGGDITANRVDGIRHALDNIGNQLQSLRRELTPTAEKERFKLEDYPIPAPEDIKKAPRNNS